MLTSLLYKLRCVLLLVRLTLLTAYCSLKALGISPQKRQQLIHHWANRVLAVAKVKRHYTEKSIPAQAMIVCNHRSLFDIPLAISCFPQSITMVGKIELFHIPLWGRALRRLGFIAIDRNNARNAQKAMLNACHQLEPNQVIWICPEGTRAPDNKLLPFKSGSCRVAIRSQLPLVPMAISGSEHILPKGSWLIQPNQTVFVKVGAPIQTTSYQPRQHEQLTQQLRQEVLKMLDQQTEEMHQSC